MAGFFSKKQYAAIADKELTIKLLNERCLECSICAMFFVIEQLDINGGLLFKKAVCCDS